MSFGYIRGFCVTIRLVFVIDKISTERLSKHSIDRFSSIGNSDVSVFLDA